MIDDPLPPLREVIASHDLAAKKSFGQNFLLDLNLTRKIARAAGDLDKTTVYEIGPGPGGLTRALLMEDAHHVVAVEKDERCLNALAEINDAYAGRLTIIPGDALQIDEPALFQGRPVQIVANLPYNVGTALLIKWLTVEDWQPWFQRLTLMFQREVADRIVARPGSKAYGRLSVLSQWRCDAKRLFDLPPQAFTPPPKVTSSVVQITPRTPDLDVSVKALGAVTAAAFGQRRKMLRASLKSLGVNSETLLEKADIDPQARAETLSIAQFVQLAKIYTAIRP